MKLNLFLLLTFFCCYTQNIPQPQTTESLQEKTTPDSPVESKEFPIILGMSSAGLDNSDPEAWFLAAFKRLSLDEKRALIRFDNAYSMLLDPATKVTNLFAEREFFKRAYPHLLYDYEKNRRVMHTVIQRFLAALTVRDDAYLYHPIDRPYLRPHLRSTPNKKPANN